MEHAASEHGGASRDRPRRTTWGVQEIVLALPAVALVFVLLFAGAALILRVFGLGGGEAEDDPVQIGALLIAQILLDLGAVGVAAALSLGRYKLPPAAWGLRRARPIAPGLCLAGLAGAFAIFIIYGVLVQVLGLDALAPKSNVPEWLFADRAVVPIAFLLVVIVAPLTEEIFFRGFIFNGLRSAFAGGQMAAGAMPRWLPGTAAALVSGGLWAAIHGQIGLIIPITGIGVLFCVLLARTGSLWNAILVHFAFNAIGFVGRLVQEL